MCRAFRRCVSGKRIAFNLLMLGGVWAVIEVLSLTTLLLGFGSLEQLRTDLRKESSQDPFRPGGVLLASPSMIHPYFGSVLQPTNDGGQLTLDNNLRVTEFGFIDDDLPIHKRSPDRVIVGILGGSVARQMSCNATSSLAEELSKLPAFSGRHFRFVRLASSGYKQPQQLLIVNYLLSLGAEFDVLVNLDGFNEVVLPVNENIPYGMSPSYPRDWATIIANKTNPEFTRMAGYVAYLRMCQRDEARIAGAFPWCYSPTASLIWRIRSDRNREALHIQLDAIGKLAQEEATYCSSGPPQHFNSQQEMYEYCIDLWSRSSMLLHQLCQARGIRYFHFLQPNQYLPGSKPIGPEEAAVAIHESQPAKVIIPDCYPLMQAEGSRLEEAGVSFTDLTNVFANHPEAIYSDGCCHVRKAGDQIMASAIGQRIVHLMRDK